jgi:hypothetical protein
MPITLVDCFWSALRLAIVLFALVMPFAFDGILSWPVAFGVAGAPFLLFGMLWRMFDEPSR